MREWPQRTAICLNCRTALCDGEQCDSRWHQAVRLDDSEGRSALIDRTFPAESSMLATGTEPKPSSPGRTWAWIAVFFAMGAPAVVWPQIFMWLLLALVASAAVKWRLRVAPVREPPLMREAVPMAGTVLDAEQTPSPLLGLPCVAFAITLEHIERDTEHAVLRDAATIGFEMETNDGQRVAIPRGRIRFNARGGPVKNREAVESHVRALDPSGDPRGEDPFRHRVAREAVIQVGDRVVLHNHVEQELDPSAAPDGYRQAAPSVLRPQGIPCIERVPDEVRRHRAPSGTSRPSA